MGKPVVANSKSKQVSLSELLLKFCRGSILHFFLSRFSCTHTDDLQGGWEKEETICIFLYHFHPLRNIVSGMTDHHVSSIISHVITKLLLDETDHL